MLLFSIKNTAKYMLIIKFSILNKIKSLIFNDKINIILSVEYSFWKNSKYKLNFGINLHVVLVEDFNSC